jgi:hypothetical protein
VKWIRRCKPERMTWELGIYGGVLFPASQSHELFNAQDQLDSGDTVLAALPEGRPRDRPARRLVPARFLGGEIEGGVMPTRVVEQAAPPATARPSSTSAPTSSPAAVLAGRPFILVGGGMLGTTGASATTSTR